ncbi:MAG TPA: hypothetical protein VFS44_07530 [Gemmatimonadaceae bacterium]|nr:hypothetical protein [Gemmatimonadaceae bacterium]
MRDRHRTVVKVGGALLARPGALESALRAIESAVARGEQVVVVPGGGPFADAVRAVDASIGLDRDAAHWMAVLAMSEYAYLIASRTARARLVETPDEIAHALHERTIPVLTPYRWLVEEDPLPHTWDVTSDSIAAWVAGRLGAPRLVLVKPVAGEMATLVDRYFDRALPPGVRAIIADDAGLTEALRAG